MRVSCRSDFMPTAAAACISIPRASFYSTVPSQQHGIFIFESTSGAEASASIEMLQLVVRPRATIGCYWCRANGEFPSSSKHVRASSSSGDAKV